MELFTLGIGNYTERDVKELARAFTGWRVSDEKAVFDPKQFDDGEKEIFGQKGKFDSESAVDVLLRSRRRRSTSSRNLLVEFVHPEPIRRACRLLREAAAASTIGTSSSCCARCSRAGCSSPTGRTAQDQVAGGIGVGDRRWRRREGQHGFRPRVADRLGPEPARIRRTSKAGRAGRRGSTPTRCCCDSTLRCRWRRSGNTNSSAGRSSSDG